MHPIVAMLSLAALIWFGTPAAAGGVEIITHALSGSNPRCIILPLTEDPLDFVIEIFDSEGITRGSGAGETGGFLDSASVGLGSTPPGSGVRPPWGCRVLSQKAKKDQLLVTFSVTNDAGCQAVVTAP